MQSNEENLSGPSRHLKQLYNDGFKTGMFLWGYDNESSDKDHYQGFVVLLWEVLVRVIAVGGFVVLGQLMTEWEQPTSKLAPPLDQWPDKQSVGLGYFAEQTYRESDVSMFTNVAFLLPLVYTCVCIVYGFLKRPQKFSGLVLCLNDQNAMMICPGFGVCEVLSWVALTAVIVTFAVMIFHQYEDRLTFFRILLVFWVLYHIAVLIPSATNACTTSDFDRKHTKIATYENKLIAYFYLESPTVLMVINLVTGVVLLFIDTQMAFVSRDEEKPRQPIVLLEVLSLVCMVAYVALAFIPPVLITLRLYMKDKIALLMMLLVQFTRYVIPAINYVVFHFLFVARYYKLHEQQTGCGEGVTANCQWCPQESLAAELFLLKRTIEASGNAAEIDNQDCFSMDFNVMSFGEFKPVRENFVLLLGVYFVVSGATRATIQLLFLVLVENRESDIAPVLDQDIARGLGASGDYTAVDTDNKYDTNNGGLQNSSTSALRRFDDFAADDEHNTSTLSLASRHEMEHHAANVVFERPGVNKCHGITQENTEEPDTHTKDYESHEEQLDNEIDAEDYSESATHPTDRQQPLV